MEMTTEFYLVIISLRKKRQYSEVSWCAFSLIRNEHGNLQSKSQYLVRTVKHGPEKP